MLKCPPVAMALRKDNFEKFRGFSGYSQKFLKFKVRIRAASGYENENKGYIVVENLSRVILENSQILGRE